MSALGTHPLANNTQPLSQVCSHHYFLKAFKYSHADLILELINFFWSMPSQYNYMPNLLAIIPARLTASYDDKSTSHTLIIPVKHTA